MNFKMSLLGKYAAIAAGVYLITAYFSVGHLHPDEYYQILEFAAYKLQLNSAHGLTWEFYQQIRSAGQAWLVVYLYKLVALINAPNPFFVAFLTRVVAGSLSLLAVVMFISAFKHELTTVNRQRWCILLGFFSYLMAFNAIRYSSENIAAKLFIISLGWLFWPQLQQQLRQQSWQRWLRYLSIGFIFGLSFVIRYQLGLMIAGLLAWLLIIQRLKFSLWLALNCGIILALACGLSIDHWFYGHWLFTPWRYFAANILAGKAASFGVDPWYLYLSIAGFIPYGPIYILAGIYFMLTQRRHVITWIMLPFILTHLYIGHKELRFLTPLLSFMPFVMLISYQSLLTRYPWLSGTKLQRLNNQAWYLNCAVLLVVMLVPAAMQIRINELLYNNYPQATAFNYITEGGNVLDFYKHLNLRPVPLSDPRQLDCRAQENCLLALTCQETLKYSAPSGRLIFSDCPKWIFKLDFNGWLERTALYNIYAIRRPVP